MGKTSLVTLKRNPFQKVETMQVYYKHGKIARKVKS
jgi:hypothetical protein